MASFYDILGASRNSDEVKLRELYLAKARLYHPDRTREDTNEQFNAIRVAWKTLSDPEKKLQYDLTLDAVAATALRRDDTCAPSSSSSSSSAASAAAPPVIVCWTEIELGEMEETEEEGVFSYACRCGDQFEVACDELAGDDDDDGSNVVDAEKSRSFFLPCGGCSLQIRLTVPAGHPRTALPAR